MVEIDETNSCKFINNEKLIITDENQKTFYQNVISEYTKRLLNKSHEVEKCFIKKTIHQNRFQFSNVIISDIEKGIKNKIVLITGAGGSIGSELCIQIYNLNPKKLILFEMNENNLY